ncbi:hypothetical protein ACHAPT_009021 [Fusarium lateritium]
MCEHCAQNGRSIIAGTNLFAYLEADANGQPWTLNLCLDLEARLLMALSSRLRGRSMEFIDPNTLPAGPLRDQLLQDLGLDFKYGPHLRKVILRGLDAQAKGLLSDAIVWEAIFKVENGVDENLYQWRVGFVLNDMTTVEGAKRYIIAKRAAEVQKQELEAHLALPPVILPGHDYINRPAASTAPQPATVAAQLAHSMGGFSASPSNIAVSTPAANPPANQGGGTSRPAHAHAHAPRMPSPLSTVQTSFPGIPAATVAPSHPQRVMRQSVAHANAPNNHNPTPSSASNQPPAASARAGGRKRPRTNPS